MKNERWMMSQLAEVARDGEKVEITPLKLIQIDLVDNVAHLFDVYQTLMKHPEYAAFDVSFSDYWGVYKTLVAATTDEFLNVVTSDYVKDMLGDMTLLMQDGNIEGFVDE